MNNKYIVGRDGTVLEKVELKKYLDWKLAFYGNAHNRCKYLRLGQAFLNDFYPGVIMSRLFYEDDPQKAETIVYQVFLDVP